MDDAEKKVAIGTLEAAHAEARANRDRAWHEMGDDLVARHWSACAGWLRNRIDRIKADEEPDWPDAMHVTSSPSSTLGGDQK